MEAAERDRILNHWVEVSDRHSAIREFIEFAHEKGHQMMYHHHGEIDPHFCFTSVPKLIDEFLGVDQTKLDDARRDLLAEAAARAPGKA